MRVHYLYCHPQTTSFHAAIRTRALAGLAAAHHEVDLLDLYADKFDPVMWEEERRDYHDTSRNQVRLADYIARLRAADALIVQFPVWSFGMPAMLKGYFDRIMMPGVAFDLSNPARSRPLLGNLRRIAGIATRPPAHPGARRRRSAAQNGQALSAVVCKLAGARGLLCALPHERRDRRGSGRVH
jgi:NAD(P)H dehydrogenase (quinone)